MCDHSDPCQRSKALGCDPPRGQSFSVSQGLQRSPVRCPRSHHQACDASPLESGTLFLLGPGIPGHPRFGCIHRSWGTGRPTSGRSESLPRIKRMYPLTRVRHRDTRGVGSSGRTERRRSILWARQAGPGARALSLLPPDSASSSPRKARSLRPSNPALHAGRMLRSRLLRPVRRRGPSLVGLETLRMRPRCPAMGLGTAAL